MKPHPRIRKTIKWAGAAVTVLLVVVWIGSGWYILHIESGWDDSADVGGGQLSVHVANDRSASAMRPSGLSVATWSNPPVWRWSFVGVIGVPLKATLGFAGTTATTGVGLPLWPLIMAFTIATVGAWRLDALARRRAKLNLCPKCGYDRTGLVSKDAKCPECGAVSAGV